MGIRRLRIALAVVACIGVSMPTTWDYTIWIPRSADADPLYRFLQDGKAGYIDQHGAVVVPATLPWYGNQGGEFHNGLLDLDDGEYVDQSGQKLKTEAKEGGPFSEGLAAAKAPNGKWGYIDTAGKFAIPPQFEDFPKSYTGSFSDGLAKIEVDGKAGYIDHSGTFVIPQTFRDADDFHEGFARVAVQGTCGHSAGDQVSVNGDATAAHAKPPACKLSFIDKTGRMISAQGYENALEFSEGLAPVLVEKRWGYIDSSGALVISPRFEKAWPFSDGLALVREKDRYGYIDREGAYRIAPQFQLADNFHEGLAVVGEPYKIQWYIDHDGRQVFGRKFMIASSFFKGLAHVHLLPGKGDTREKFEYIDHEGRTVFAYSVAPEE